MCDVVVTPACFLIQGDIGADQSHPEIAEVILIHHTEEDRHLLGNCCVSAVKATSISKALVFKRCSIQ